METIKISVSGLSEVKISLVEELTDKKTETRSLCCTKSEAIELANAIIDHFSEWLPIEDAPKFERIWVKWQDNTISQEHIYLIVGKLSCAIGYQPIRKPKP